MTYCCEICTVSVAIGGSRSCDGAYVICYP